MGKFNRKNFIIVLASIGLIAALFYGAIRYIRLRGQGRDIRHVLVEPLPPPIIYDDDELVWSTIDHDYLMTCWADGTFTTWRMSDKSQVSSFTVLGYQYPDTLLQCSMDITKPILAVINKEKAPRVLQLYDIFEGELFNTISVSYYLDDVRFSEDGISCAYASSREAVRLDLDRGLEVWKFNIESIKTPMTEYVRVCPDMNTVVLFSEPQITAVNPKGDILWQKHIDMNTEYAEPYIIQKYGKKIVLSLDSISGIHHRYCAIDIKDGNNLWQRESPYGALKGVSVDFKTQVWFEGNSLTVTNLPDNKAVSIPDVNYCPEVVFVSDEKLICLPGLEFEEENTEEFYIKYVRTSHILEVVDIPSKSIKQKIRITKNKLEMIQ